MLRIPSPRLFSGRRRRYSSSRSSTVKCQMKSGDCADGEQILRMPKKILCVMTSDVPAITRFIHPHLSTSRANIQERTRRCRSKDLPLPTTLLPPRSQKYTCIDHSLRPICAHSPPEPKLSTSPTITNPPSPLALSMRIPTTRKQLRRQDVHIRPRTLVALQNLPQIPQPLLIDPRIRRQDLLRGRRIDKFTQNRDR